MQWLCNIQDCIYIYLCEIYVPIYSDCQEASAVYRLVLQLKIVGLFKKQNTWKISTSTFTPSKGNLGNVCEEAGEGKEGKKIIKTSKNLYLQWN